jgi:hypothetical protein
MLLAGHFSDMSFAVSLTDASGKQLPVPEPAREMRVHYCPPAPGKYTLVVTPNTADHFTHAAVDCPRNGPEGVRRGRALKLAR